MELEQGLAQVQVGLALVVQVVGPVAVIRHGIIRRQVVQLLERRRRDLAGNQHQQHQQGASSSSRTPEERISPKVIFCGWSVVMVVSSRTRPCPTSFAGWPKSW